MLVQQAVQHGRFLAQGQWWDFKIMSAHDGSYDLWQLAIKTQVIIVDRLPALGHRSPMIEASGRDSKIQP